MKTFEVNPFNGQKTVEKNKKLVKNAAFYSKFKNFEGKLSSSHHVVKFPITGVETYYINNEKIQVDNNSYLITNPKTDIEVQVKSHSEVIGICIGFTSNYLNNLAYSVQQKLNLSLDNPFINNTDNIRFFTKKNRLFDNKFCNILQHIKQELLNKTITNRYQEDEFYLGFGEALIEHELAIHAKISQLPHSKQSTREEIYRRIDVMNQYIHDNFIESISIEELSQISCLSKYHAIRCYQKIEGISPYQKIIALRLQKAIQLLAKGFSISEASDSCGFTDYRAFSKLFKKQLGLSPSKYQKRWFLKV